jgi:hypothetical protein
MTMCPLTHHSLFDNSRLPKTLQWFPTPPLFTRPRPPATFFYSPRSNYSWKGIVLTQLRRSMQNHKRLSIHSHFKTSRDARNHEKHTEITVYMPKETTLKETVETRSYSKKHFLWSNSLKFWVAPRILKQTVPKNEEVRYTRDIWKI